MHAEIGIPQMEEVALFKQSILRLHVAHHKNLQRTLISNYIKFFNHTK